MWHCVRGEDPKALKAVFAGCAFGIFLIAKADLPPVPEHPPRLLDLAPTEQAALQDFAQSRCDIVYGTTDRGEGCAERLVAFVNTERATASKLENDTI